MLYNISTMESKIYSDFVTRLGDTRTPERMSASLKTLPPRYRLILYQSLYRGPDPQQPPPPSLSGRHVVPLDPDQHRTLQGLIKLTFAQEKTTLVSLAAETGDLDLLKHLIDQHESLITPNRFGVPPLITALRNQQLDFVMELLNHGAAKPLPPQYKNELLMGLLAEEQEEAVVHLINSDFEVDVADTQGVTPLMMACFQQRWDLAELMINLGADIHKADCSGWTPLHYCFIQGEEGMKGAKLCLEHHADFPNFFASFPQDEIRELSTSFQNDRMAFLNDIDNYPTLQQLLFLHSMDSRLEKLRGEMAAPLAPDVLSLLDHLVARVPPFMSWREFETNHPDQLMVLNASRLEGSTTFLTAAEDMILGWESANALAMQWAESKIPLTREMVSQLNALIDPESKGEYRTDIDITVADNIMKAYLFGQQVDEEVNQFTSWLNENLEAMDNREINPIELAARAYQYLISIHPFTNGNGRTARLVMDYVLKRAGLPPCAIGNDVDVAAFIFFPNNISPNILALKIYAGVLKACDLLNKGLDV